MAAPQSNRPVRHYARTGRPGSGLRFRSGRSRSRWVLGRKSARQGHARLCPGSRHTPYCSVAT